MGAPSTSEVMELRRITAADPAYPKALVDTGPVLFARGNLVLLDHRLIGLLCSVRCPGMAILRAFDLGENLAVSRYRGY